MNGEVVWGVMYMMAVLLTGTGWVIYYIMRRAYMEMRDGEVSVTYPIIGTVTDTSSDEPRRTHSEDERLEIGAATYAR